MSERFTATQPVTLCVESNEFACSVKADLHKSFWFISCTYGRYCGGPYGSYGSLRRIWWQCYQRIYPYRGLENINAGYLDFSQSPWFRQSFWVSTVSWWELTGPRGASPIMLLSFRKSPDMLYGTLKSPSWEDTELLNFEFMFHNSIHSMLLWVDTSWQIWQACTFGTLHPCIDDSEDLQSVSKCRKPI